MLALDRPSSLSFYEDRLQEGDQPVNGGFFVYSQRAYSDSSHLRAAIGNAVRLVAFRDIQFSLYWGPVNSWKLNLSGNYALQVEVDATDYDVLKRATLLPKLWGHRYFLLKGRSVDF